MRTLRIALVTLFAVVAGFTAAALPVDEKGFDDPARLARLVRDGKPAYLLVDVRTKAEYVTGHVPTAINVPVDVIGLEPPTDDKKALIIVYCRSGNRSATAQKLLQGLGYANVVDFGAVSRWQGVLITGPAPGKAN